MLKSRDLIVLPCRKLIITNIKYNSEKTRIKRIREWADKDFFSFSFGFLLSKPEPAKYGDYFICMGDVHQNQLVTSEYILEVVAETIKNTKHSFDIIQAQDHLGYYFNQLEQLPDWGEADYYRLINSGRTPRTLFGPHSEGQLNKDQKRRVVIEDDSMIYGPLLS